MEHILCGIDLQQKIDKLTLFKVFKFLKVTLLLIQSQQDNFVLLAPCYKVFILVFVSFRHVYCLVQSVKTVRGESKSLKRPFNY